MSWINYQTVIVITVIIILVLNFLITKYYVGSKVNEIVDDKMKKMNKKIAKTLDVTLKKYTYPPTFTEYNHPYKTNDMDLITENNPDNRNRNKNGKSKNTDIDSIIDPINIDDLTINDDPDDNIVNDVDNVDNMDIMDNVDDMDDME